MFVNFSEETKKIIKRAIYENKLLKHPYVGSEHILLSMIKNNENIKRAFNKQKITYDVFKNKLINIVGVGKKESDFVLYTPLLKRVLSNSIIEAREVNNKYVTPEIIMFLILDEDKGVACSILSSLNVNKEKLIIDIKKELKGRTFKKKLLIDELGIDLNKKAQDGLLDPVIGRNSEINKMIQILLRRKKNNPILIGPAGTGKTAIVEHLAGLIVEGKVPNYLKNKRIVSLNIFTLVAGTKYRGEFEEKMKTLIRELEENKDIILFIDEIHTIVGAGGAEGAIDASNIFKPALARGNIKVIGATTIDEYNKYILPDNALSRRFQKLNIKEPTKENLKVILKKIKPIYENHHNVLFSEELIDYLINLSSKYLKDRYEPDRSIDILDEVCALVSLKETSYDKVVSNLNKKINQIIMLKNKSIKKGDFKEAFKLKAKENSINNKIKSLKPIKKVVTIKDIQEIIRGKNEYLLIDNNDSYYFEKLRNNLNKEIINQKENIERFINYLKLDTNLSKKSCLSLIIEGYKGSGKTYFSKTVSKKLVSNIIELDFNEYKNSYSLKNIIGNNKDSLVYKIKSNPSSAIIIDNVDSAAPEVLDALVNILKSGKISDIDGNVVDFTNSIVIINNRINNISLGFNKNNNSNNTPNEILSLIKNKIVIKSKSNEDLRKIVINKIKETELINNVQLNKEEYEKITDMVLKQNSLYDIENIINERIEKKLVN